MTNKEKFIEKKIQELIPKLGFSLQSINKIEVVLSDCWDAGEASEFRKFSDFIKQLCDEATKADASLTKIKDLFKLGTYSITEEQIDKILEEK